MAPVPIDPELIAKLTTNGGEVPLTGPDGTPVGFFVRPDLYTAMRNAYAEATARVTEADCRRALANPNRHGMDEVQRLLEGK